MKVTPNFIFFYGGIYSQWYKSPFTIDGIEYNCAEQYMMAEKARLFNDLSSVKAIMKTLNPNEQKSLGRKVKNFDSEKWLEICKDVVYKGNLAKFTQSSTLKESLLNSGDRELVEASPFDKIWGIGLSEFDSDILDKSKWKGTNWLGEAIMKVRETLRS